ncbi:MAG TPA: aldehyde oxidase, partial [Planctomycetota bacterium]|nr:aldehyde oxidase [Planctomycetota bacterium]
MNKPFKVVGTSFRKTDGMSKTTGRTLFADDLVSPGMLFAKIHHSTRPHAKIRRIDTSRAAKHRGVMAVLTGESLPIKYGILPVSQDETALAVDKVRYVGDPVAAVVAV